MNVRHVFSPLLGLAVLTAFSATPAVSAQGLAYKVPVTSPCFTHISKAVGAAQGRVITMSAQSVEQANASTYILPFRVAASEEGLPHRIPKLPSLRNKSPDKLLKASVNSFINGSWLAVTVQLRHGKPTGNYVTQYYIDVQTAAGNAVPATSVCVLPSGPKLLPVASLPDLFAPKPPAPDYIPLETL